MNADDLWPPHVPGETRHDVDGVGATDADRHHGKAAGIGCVAVGADHHAAGERVLLEHDLVNDAAARLPEPGAVAGAHALEKVVDLLVVLRGGEQVPLAVDASLYEMVAVRRGGHCHLVESGGHELQPRHLGRGILHGDAVRRQVDVGDAALEFLVATRQVCDQDLLRQRERPTQPFTPERHGVAQPGVHPFDQLDRRTRVNCHGQLPARRLL